MCAMINILQILLKLYIPWYILRSLVLWGEGGSGGLIRIPPPHAPKYKCEDEIIGIWRLMGVGVGDDP